MAASLKKIAAELGISHVLVSRVLSGRMGTTGASAATRAAILKKAKELDYKPNRLAVALKRGRKGAIGVFVHRMGMAGSDIAINFLSSLAKTLDQGSYRLWLRFFETDEDFLKAFDEKLQSEVDGLIVGGAEHPGLVKKLQKIDKEGLPVVSVFCESPSGILTTNVAVDYEAQCYLTTRHLLELGCRHLAHFRIFELRYQGFLRAHREMGIPVRPELVVPHTPGDYPFFKPKMLLDYPFYIEDGERFAGILLSEGHRFDGIVAQSDDQAVGAIRELRKHGLRIPEDVKVTGVDDSPLAIASSVPLTSTTTEMEQCGREAVKKLLRKIEKEPADSTVLQPRLVVRQSTKAA